MHAIEKLLGETETVVIDASLQKTILRMFAGAPGHDCSDCAWRINIVRNFGALAMNWDCDCFDDGANGILQA